MIQQSQTLHGGEQSTLKKNQVDSIPVIVDKKFSTTQIVGYLSLIPTSTIDRLSMIDSIELRRIRIPSAVKSIKRKFRVIAK